MRRSRDDMQSLQDNAFAIDDGNNFESLGGTPHPFVDLSTNFYTRVYRMRR